MRGLAEVYAGHSCAYHQLQHLEGARWRLWCARDAQSTTRGDRRFSVARPVIAGAPPVTGCTLYLVGQAFTSLPPAQDYT